MTNMKKVIKFFQTKEGLLLLIVVVLGLLLRLYRINELFYYTMDEEVMNLIQRRIVLLQHFPLIGSVSPLSTYLGPIFYYFGAVILAISNLNPLGLGIFGSLLGAANIFFIYFVASRFFDRRVGILAAIFYSFSFLQTIFDRRYWHLTPGPFLSMLILFALYKIKKGSIKFIYLLTGALIFGWNTDYTNLVLFLFTFLVWIIFRLPVRRKEVAIAIFIFILSNAPLVLFELRHDFLNSKSFVSYFTTKHQESKSATEGVLNASQSRETLGKTRIEQATLTSLLPYITFSRAIFTTSDLNISAQHTYCKDYIFARNNAQGKALPGAAAIIILAFIFLTIKNWQSKFSTSYKLILGFFLVFQLGVLIYSFLFKGDVFEHYLSTLLPYLFIILAVVLSWIYQRFKVMTIILVGFFILSNIYLTFNSFNPLGYKNKIEATQFALNQVSNREFSLDSVGSCFRYDGYYYPFILQGRHPVKSYQDSNYSWLFDYPVSATHSANMVVMVSKGKFEDSEANRIYNMYQPWVRVRKNFGGIEVLILDNSQGEIK